MENKCLRTKIVRGICGFCESKRIARRPRTESIGRVYNPKIVVTRVVAPREKHIHSATLGEKNWSDEKTTRETSIRGQNGRGPLRVSIEKRKIRIG